MESAQTGQVGKVLPRGNCLMIVIDRGPHWPFVLKYRNLGLRQRRFGADHPRPLVTRGASVPFADSEMAVDTSPFRRARRKPHQPTPQRLLEELPQRAALEIQRDPTT